MVCENSLKKYGHTTLWIAAIILLAAFSLLWIERGWTHSDNRYPQPVEHLRSTECWKLTIALVQPPSITVPFLTEVERLCYIERGHEFNLENKRINRNIYTEQLFVGRVILWMVVVITVSGVLLAALQLVAAFKLADKGNGTLGQDGSIDVANGKISVKSSVTGLLILVVSFAFFFVLVEKVYTIREPKNPDNQNINSLAAGVPEDQIPANEDTADANTKEASGKDSAKEAKKK